MQDHGVEDKGMSGYRGYDVCAICGETIEGRSISCSGGVAHESCLDELEEPKEQLHYMRCYPNVLLNWLDDHLSDDNLNGFWKAFGDDHKSEIERWATS